MSKQDEFGGRGRDEFLFEYVVSKANDRKIFMHKSFEEVVARYWQLIRQEPDFNQSKDTINCNQYSSFMKRIYKVLLPLYRDAEVSGEIAKQWVNEANGQKEMSLTLFQKSLFKIAHSWTIHIDIEEYVEFLTKLYERIIAKKIISADGSTFVLLPEIFTEITQDDGGAEDDEWQSCYSNEEQYSHFDYRHEEDEETKEVKMYKKKKGNDSGGEDDTAAAPVFSSREPFMFKESVKFFRDEFDSAPVPSEEGSDDDEEIKARRAKQKERPEPKSDDTVVDIMAAMNDILPMGYPTEQFFAKTKNEVTAAYKKIREEKKKALLAMKREILEGATTLGAEKRAPPNDKDAGLLDALGIVHDLDFPIFCSSHKIRVRCFAKIKDVAYNALRNLLKEFSTFMLRPLWEYPRNPMAKQKAPKLLSSKEPDTLVNTFGYNPALERRISYKNLELIIPGVGKQKKIINVNYLIEDPVFDTAFRSDVTRVETNNKLANKAPEEFLREEEFVNVTTSFRDVLTLMLVKKFETFFTNRLQEQDATMQERSEKIHTNEMQRKEFAQRAEPLTQKGLQETFDEKPFMKLMKGPFYDLMSREGIQEDNFVHCGTRDLIDSANKEAQRILLIGKPRVGRTTLSTKIAKELDLVRISPDVWIEDILNRIKNRDPELNEYEEEENEGEAEEGAEEKEKKLKEWRTPLEVKISDAVMDGRAPDEDEIDEIIMDMINSPSARTKGFILDVDFSALCEKTWTARITRAEMLAQNEEFTHIVELLIDDDEVINRASEMLYSLAPKPEDQDEELGPFHPDHGKVFSAWERKQRIKPPKKIELDENGDPIEEEEEEEEEQGPPPFDESSFKSPMFVRVCEDKDRFLQELDYYSNIERPAMDDFIINCYDQTYIKLDVAGMTPDQVCETVKFRLKPDESAPDRPVGKAFVEDNAPSGDYKALLTDNQEPVPIGKEEDDRTFTPLARQWSLWKQIDPVALSQGSVDKGSAEFAAEYAHNVFVFKDEKNRDIFANSPKDFLKAAPQMPKDYRVLVVGPACSGVKTQAQMMSDFYGWKVVDFPKIVREKLQEINEMPEKLPNNISEDGPCMVCLKQEELDAIRNHAPFPAQKFMPWILEFLGVPLAIRPPPPPEPEPDTEAMTEEELKAHNKKVAEKAKIEEKAAKELNEKNAAKAAREVRRQQALEEGQNIEGTSIDYSVEEIIIDDLEIDKLIPDLGDSKKLHVPGGFIMYGFPQAEAHIEKLKEAGIEFDRVIYLNDAEGEEGHEPGKALAERHDASSKSGVAYEWDLENERATKIVGQVKEFIGEETVEVVFKEVDCKGDQERVFIRIRTAMDPFFIQCDDKETVIQNADIGNPKPTNPEELADADPETIWDRLLPRSDFGPYCPVTYVKEGVLQKKGAEEEYEETINGKTYVFAGAAEQEEFKINPEKFLKVQKGDATLPLKAPMPKIMIMGTKGSGVTTQIQMLCDLYKLDSLELHTEFLKRLDKEKKLRQRSRRINQGFVPPPEDFEPTEEAPVWVNPEVEEDTWEQEEREAHEKQMMKETIDASKGLIIDGNWTTIPEDAVSAPLQMLVEDSRRMPEMVIFLECSSAAMQERCRDDKEIKEKFDKIVKDIKERIAKETEAARKEKLAEVEGELAAQKKEYEEACAAAEGDDKPEEPEWVDVAKVMEEWDAERKESDEAAFEDDPDKPDLEEMTTAETEKLEEQRSKDLEFFQEFKDWLDEKKIENSSQNKDGEFIHLKTDISPEYVFIKLQNILQKRIKNRHDLIEREQCEALMPIEVPFYEKSYKYKVSKFGVNSPINPFNPSKTKKFAVLYRERIYFPADADEQEAFMLEPSKYVNGGEAVPNDILIRPQISVLGLPKSGKSELCQRIQATTGAVHLKMEEIIEGQVHRDAIFAKNLRDQTMFAGQAFDDEALIKLLHRRLQEPDCKRNGWIIENFPQTRDQAVLMAQKSILPNNVLTMHVDPSVCYKRAKGDNSFDYINDILKLRIENTLVNQPQVNLFFQKFYNSVTSIDGTRSRWFIENTALEAIEATLKARMQFVHNYYGTLSEESPCVMQNMNIDRIYLKQSLSQYRYMCPVTWKMKKTFVSCAHRPEFSVLYRHQFYYFNGAEERDIFVKNPNRFADKTIFTNEKNTPLLIRTYKAAELVAQEKALQSHCPVALKDEGKVVKGNALLVVQYKDNRYVFVDEEKLVRFFTEPTKYADAQLPVKMPPNMDPVQLVKLQGTDDSITFLEQALGSIVTCGLREVGDNRLKYPTLSVKETMLKLFAIFLKAENPANTTYMKEKYHKKMQAFIEKCEVPIELNELAEQKKKSESKKKAKGWPQFKEDYYNSLGAKYDQILKDTEKERKENFQNYIK